MYTGIPYHCPLLVQTLPKPAAIWQTPSPGNLLKKPKYMPYSNFCPACGEALPLLPDRWQERIWIKLTGCRCPACGYRLREGHWKSFGLGMGLGLVVGLGLTTRQAVQPAPPLPLLTTGHLLVGRSPDRAEAVSETPGTTISRERHRCGAPTKKGTPCQRWVSGTTGYCWQHRRN